MGIWVNWGLEVPKWCKWCSRPYMFSSLSVFLLVYRIKVVDLICGFVLGFGFIKVGVCDFGCC
jgi:hypothetical protein